MSCLRNLLVGRETGGCMFLLSLAAGQSAGARLDKYKFAPSATSETSFRLEREALPLQMSAFLALSEVIIADVREKDVQLV
jgi:hypothetical protein